MNTDTNPLQERVARALHEHWVAEPAGGTATEAWTDCTCGIRITVPGGTRDEAARRGEAHQAEQIAAAVLPIIARVRRDAERGAIDGLIADKAHMTALLRAENGGNVEDVLTHYRDTHYNITEKENA